MTIKQEALKLYPPIDNDWQRDAVRTALRHAYKSCAFGESVLALAREVELLGAACGVASTWLAFHGLPSTQLDACIKNMKAHENRALKAIEAWEEAK